MSKKLHSITVKGNHHKWSFHIEAEPSHVKDWRDDGLEIDEIINIIPEWVVDMGLIKVWCRLQDWFNFKFWRD